MDFWDFHSHQRRRFALCSCDLLREEVPSKADCPYLSVGLHPWSLPKDVSSPTVETALGQLNKLAREGRIVAVGEAGWDAHSLAAMDYQQQLVEAQWQIAEENRLPMILHVVKRWQELEYFIHRSRPTVPLIVHGFRGKAPLARGDCFLRPTILLFPLRLSIEPLQRIWGSTLACYVIDLRALPISFLESKNFPKYVSSGRFRVPCRVLV